MDQEDFDENKWQEELANLKSKNQLAVKEGIDKIQELVKEIGSFNLIANISYYNNMRSADGYTDYQEGKLPIIPEYVSILSLIEGFNHPKLEIENPQKAHEILQEIQELAMSIVSKAPFLKALESEKDDKFSIDSLNSITTHLEREEYFVRNPAFEEHHWEINEEFFSNFDSILEDILGFNIIHASDLVLTIHDLIVQKTLDHIKHSFDYADQQYFDLLRFKSDGKTPDLPLELSELTKLSELSKKEIKQHFRYNAELHVTATLGSSFELSVAELSKESQIEEEIVKSFLDAFSIEFKEIGTEFKEPQSINPLKNKPIIRANGKFIVPSQDLLDWAIDRKIEKTLQVNKKKYSSLKHDYLMDKSLSAISEIMPEAEVHVNCEYFFDGNNGETDGLIIWDDCLFILESKAHNVTDPAKRGGKRRVEKHLDEIFNKAYEQGMKTLTYLESNHEVEFKPKKSGNIRIKFSEYRNVFLIINILSPLDHISSLIKKSNDLGLFNGKIYPYVVSLYDLLVLRDIIDFPSLFPYYLKRRTSFFESRKYFITSEINVFGNFLNYGLHFDHLDPENKMSMISLPEFLDEFNQYYFYKAGKTKKQYKKPEYRIDSKMKKFINRVEECKVPGKISATLLLLALSSESQREFVQKVELMKKSTKKDGQLHDFSFGGGDDDYRWGITYMIHKSSSKIEEKLLPYCKYKRDQLNTDIWIGLGDTSTGPVNIDQIIILKNVG